MLRWQPAGSPSKSGSNPESSFLIPVIEKHPIASLPTDGHRPLAEADLPFTDIREGEVPRENRVGGKRIQTNGRPPGPTGDHWAARRLWINKNQADGKSAATSIGCEHFPEACDPPAILRTTGSPAVAGKRSISASGAVDPQPHRPPSAIGDPPLSVPVSRQVGRCRDCLAAVRPRPVAAGSRSPGKNTRHPLPFPGDRFVSPPGLSSPIPCLRRPGVSFRWAAAPSSGVHPQGRGQRPGDGAHLRWSKAEPSTRVSENGDAKHIGIIYGCPYPSATGTPPDEPRPR